MESVAIQGVLRKQTGKKGAKAVRNAGRIPAELYGGDTNIHFSTTQKEVKTLIYTPDFKLAEVNIDGETYKCIVKDIQFHPVTDEIVHIDFLRLIPGRTIKVDLPIAITGQSKSPGMKAGGKLMSNVRRVKVKTTPEHMVHELKLDVSQLSLGQAIRVRDIPAVEGIEIMVPGGTPVASVEVPRALRSATDAAEREGEEEEEAV